MFRNKFLTTKALSFKSYLCIFVSICILISALPLSVLVAALGSNNDVISFTDDFGTADGNNATDPLGNGWQYGSTALGKLTIDEGKVVLNAGDNDNAYNRVVRPTSEARLNQKVSINFDAADLNKYSTSGNATDRFRLLSRVQNNPANDGKAVSYYAALDWADGIKIGKFVNGAATQLASSQEAVGGWYIPYTKPKSGTYRFEFLAEGSNPTKLTVNYYETTDGKETLINGYSITDNTSNLQSAGTVGFHASSSGGCSAVYTDFSYFGTNEGNVVPIGGLSALTLSEGVLGFNSGVYTYSVELDNAVSSIKIKPTAYTSNAVITVNEEKVVSGTESSPVPLEVGVSKTIAIVVSDRSLGTITYTINVLRKNKTKVVSFVDNFSAADGNNATDPLGNGWQYGSTALGKLIIDEGKVVLKAGDNENAYNRVVRPASEKRLNQKVSINFDSSDLNKYSSSNATDRYRLLARVQNNPANDGKAVSYYASLDWADGIKIGKFVNGAATQLASSQEEIGGWYIPYTKPKSGTYRFEFLAEGSNPTKLTVNYYETTGDTETLINGYSITDNTSELQGAGTVGMHVSSSATCSAVYTYFSYFGTDEGKKIPVPTLDSLQLSAGNINFNGLSYTYNVNVENEVTEIKVTPTTNLSDAVITVNGKTVISGTESDAISLDEGIAKKIKVVVKSAILGSKTYTITVTRKEKTKPLNFFDDFSNADNSNATNPLGNGWQYGSTALDKLTVEDGKVILKAGDNENLYNRVVRPFSEARLNQRISVNFDAADLNTNSTATNRYRLLARVQNDPANNGSVVSYYVALDWGDGIKIGKCINGVMTELLTTNPENGGDYVPKKPIEGTYRLELCAEGSNPTKLTVNYYNTSNGADELIKSYRLTDDTAVLQGAGTVGFNVSASATCSAVYTDFSYFGTDEGKNLPFPMLDGLKLSAGKVDFNSLNYYYKVNLNYNVSEIKVTPTANAANAVITVNGKVVASGNASSAIALEAGSTKKIEIVVKTGDFQSNTYTIYVKRGELTNSILFEDDFSNADNSNATNPLGNGWQYGSTALDKLTVEDGKVILKAGDNENLYNRVVRPFSEARLNQRISVNFDAADLNKNSTATNRYRLLARVQNDPANNGSVVSYYVALDWGDGIKIGKCINGVMTELLTTNPENGGDYVPKKPIEGTYRLELYAEGSNPTKLTVNYYDTSKGADELIKSYHITDDTGVLQGAGTVGFNVSASATCSAVYTDFSYFGTDEGNEVPRSRLDSLSLSNGTITFDKEKFLYNVTVGNDVSKIFVTPVTSNKNSIITVNGLEVKSGKKSDGIALEAGKVKKIQISVSTQGIGVTHYIINVTRMPEGAWDGKPATKYAGGSGTIRDPYLISNAAEFLYFANQVNDPNRDKSGYSSGAYYRITNDIILNFNYEDYENWGTTPPANKWTPIGYERSKTFSGTLNGTGHTIYGLYCDSEDNYNYVGLFGFFMGNVEHLNVKNSYISGGNKTAGGLLGFAYCLGTMNINNCEFDGIIKGGRNSGGIAGDVNTEGGSATLNMNNCRTNGVLNGAGQAGGLIGSAAGSTAARLNISNCYSAMNVSAPSYCGGFIGSYFGIYKDSAYEITIRKSHFAGKVNSNTPIIGDMNAGFEVCTILPNCSENVYYKQGSYSGTVGNVYGAVEKSKKEFENGNITKILNAAAVNPITDLWNWKNGAEYPIHDINNDITNFINTFDDSLFNDGDWAANLVNEDGGNLIYNTIDDDASVEDTKDVTSDAKSKDDKGTLTIIVISILGFLLFAAIVLWIILTRKKRSK